MFSRYCVASRLVCSRRAVRSSIDKYRPELARRSAEVGLRRGGFEHRVNGTALGGLRAHPAGRGGEKPVERQGELVPQQLIDAVHGDSELAAIRDLDVAPLLQVPEREFQVLLRAA